MAERFSELRCKEVINLPDGCRLGYTADLELDPEEDLTLSTLEMRANPVDKKKGTRKVFKL